MILCISVLSVVISPFSFLILLIWFFSLCFLMSLVCQFIYLFKEPGFSFVDFCYGLFCFFCIYFYPNFFIISFLLLTLGFFISFYSCFRCRVRLFSWLFSCFLRCACIAMNLALSTAFTVSHRFGGVVFSFSFISMHILVSFLFLLWFLGYSEVCCLASICLYF